MLGGPFRPLGLKEKSPFCGSSGFLLYIMFFSLVYLADVFQFSLFYRKSWMIPYAFRSFSPRFREIVTYPEAIASSRCRTWSKVLLTPPTSASGLCYIGPSWCHCGFIYRLNIFQPDPLLSFFSPSKCVTSCFRMLSDQDP